MTAVAAPEPPPVLALRRIGETDLPAIAALDRAALGMDRRSLLEALLAVSEGVVLDTEDCPAGFALVRRFGRGEMIGPVVAPDAAGARALIAHLLRTRTGVFMRIDVPDGSGLGDWLASRGLGCVDEPVRMIRGQMPAPAGPVQSFALASQSFG